MSKPLTTEPLLLSAREAAKALAVSERKLWAMTFEDEPALPHVRLGKLVRYRPETLRAWLAEREGGTQ